MHKAGLVVLGSRYVTFGNVSAATRHPQLASGSMYQRQEPAALKQLKSKGNHGNMIP
jgi:hypothetical protein